MKSFQFLGLACALGLVCAPAAMAANPALLPLPTVEQSYSSPYAAETRGPAQVAAVPNDGGMVRRGWMMASTPEATPSPSDSVGPGAQLNAAPQSQPAPAMDSYSDGGYTDAYGNGDVYGGGLFGGGAGGGFYAWGGALIMVREQPRNVSLAYDDANPTGSVLDTNQGGNQWAGGFEVGMGFAVSPTARIEALYWGLFPAGQSSGIDGTDVVGNLNSRLNFDPLTFSDGVPANETPVNDWYQNSERQWFDKKYSVHNVEINFWKGGFGWGGGYGMAGGMGGYGSMGNGTMGGGSGCGCTDGSCGSGSCGYGDCCGGCCNRCNIQFLAGFRYFRFNEEFTYHADNFTEDPFYRITTNNNMYGFQLGARADYLVGQRWGFYATPKFGIYNNSVRMGQTINHPEAPWVNGPTSGAAAVDSTSTVNPGQVYDITSTEDTVSFLGQVDIGATYYATPNWSFTAGYRVVAVSNVAITTEQIPSDFGNIDGVYDINTNSSLVLHGLFLQTQYMW